MIKHASLAIKFRIERQLSAVKFFAEEDKSELTLVPLTNSCAESNFGKLTYDLSQTSGAYVDINRMSKKNIIKSDNSSSLSSAEKRDAQILGKKESGG